MAGDLHALIFVASLALILIADIAEGHDIPHVSVKTYSSVEHSEGNSIDIMVRKSKKSSSSSSSSSSKKSKSSKKAKKSKITTGSDATNDPDDDGSACFPASASVTLKTGKVTTMDELVVGDSVLTRDGHFSEIYAFAHKLSSVHPKFYRIATRSGHSLTLSSGHYLYLNGQMQAAKTAMVGDHLVLGSGVETKIASIEERVFGRGLYNPMTVSGDILVNGLLASTYTTAVEPALSHALLMPPRVIYEWYGLDATFGILELESGLIHKAFRTLLPKGNVVAQ